MFSNLNFAAGSSGTDIKPYTTSLLERLVPLLQNEQTPRTLAENAAIPIGRLGLVAPELVAPHLKVFIVPWCKALRSIRDNEEKESAFRGLCEMIKLNPQGVIEVCC